MRQKILKGYYDMGREFGKTNQHPEQLYQEFWMVRLNHLKTEEMPKLLEEFAEFKRGVEKTNKYENWQ